MTALKKAGLLRTYYRDRLRGYRLGIKAKSALLDGWPERFTFCLMLVHVEYGVGGLHLTLTIPGHKRNRKVYQTKSGYWYCNLTSEKGCPERQVLNLEGYQSKEDILRHMKSLRTDYCILRCSMEGFTV